MGGDFNGLHQGGIHIEKFSTNKVLIEPQLSLIHPHCHRKRWSTFKTIIKERRRNKTNNVMKSKSKDKHSNHGLYMLALYVRFLVQPTVVS